jgi:hypothetical protein
MFPWAFRELHVGYGARCGLTLPAWRLLYAPAFEELSTFFELWSALHDESDAVQQLWLARERVSRPLMVSPEPMNFGHAAHHRVIWSETAGVSRVRKRV